MTDSAAPTAAPLKAKGKKKPLTHDPKLNTLVEALREYERVSYYLATQKRFDFTMDDEAQRHFHTFNPSNASAITKLTQLRTKEFGKPIPKGLHIPGLAIRTAKRMERNTAKKGKKAS